jgi:hypothetical protein
VDVKHTGGGTVVLALLDICMGMEKPTHSLALGHRLARICKHHCCLARVNVLSTFFCGWGAELGEDGAMLPFLFWLVSIGRQVPQR